MKKEKPHLANPLDKKPALMEAGKPVMAAYNHVLRWADGMGGVSRADLEWYLTEGDGAVLTPETRILIRLGVERLIDTDRELQSAEMKKMKDK